MKIVESLLVLGLSCFPVWAQQESKEPPSKQETAKLRLEAAKKKSKAADQAWSDSGLRNHGFASYGPSEAMMDAEAEFCEAQNEFILASGQPDSEVTHCKVTSIKKGFTYSLDIMRMKKDGSTYGIHYILRMRKDGTAEMDANTYRTSP